VAQRHAVSPRRRSIVGFDRLRLEGALLRPDLLTTPDAQWRDLLEAGDDLEEDWQSLALRGVLTIVSN